MSAENGDAYPSADQASQFETATYPVRVAQPAQAAAAMSPTTSALLSDIINLPLCRSFNVHRRLRNCSRRSRDGMHSPTILQVSSRYEHERVVLAEAAGDLDVRSQVPRELNRLQPHDAVGPHHGDLRRP